MILSFARIFRGILAACRDEQVRSLLFLTFSMIIGATFFYRYVEGWSFLDSVYFSVITIATVGYGDLSPKTDLGKIFTMFYILIGLGIFVAAAGAVAASITSPSSKESK